MGDPQPRRPSWDEYFIKFANDARSRSTCMRRTVGAVIVVEKNIVATGYNGAPKGVAHCDEVGCVREAQNVPSGERHELCRGLHAEQNAIIQAAFHGTRIRGGTIYCTTCPCSICAKMLINAGIARVVFSEDYRDPLAVDLLTEAGVGMRQITRAE